MLPWMVAASESIGLIRRLSASRPALNRCDGTPAELVEYRSGSYEFGWRVQGTPSPAVGDPLVGTVGRGANRVIINVNLVESVTNRGVEWADATDAPIHPAVGWTEVAARAGMSPRAWGRLEGERATTFLRALIDELESRSDVPEIEGQRQVSTCVRRSAKNRTRKIDEAAGVCEACKTDFRSCFGPRGDRALEVHHRRPLSEANGEVATRLADLIVLCASCHRLVHADPKRSIEALQAAWLLGG